MIYTSLFFFLSFFLFCCFLFGTYLSWVHMGDLVELDSWAAAKVENGMRQVFIVQDYNAGEVIVRATKSVG